MSQIDLVLLHSAFLSLISGSVIIIIIIIFIIVAPRHHIALVSGNDLDAFDAAAE